MLTSALLGTTSLTGVDSYGVLWGVTALDGWGSTGTTIAPVQKPRQDGAWAGLSYRKPRSITLSGEAVIPSQDQAAPAVDRLISAATLDETALTITESGQDRYALVRRDGPVVAQWKPGADHIFQWSVQLVATDVRKFATDLTASTALPSTSGGLTVPFTVPFSINATTVTGQISLTNPGNTNGPVTLRIDGPVTAPVVTHVASGKVLAFASSVSLGSGEYVLVDMEAHTVLAQGQASRAGWVTSRGWSQFEPGANTWAFTAASYTSGALLTVTATPAWE